MMSIISKQALSNINEQRHIRRRPSSSDGNLVAIAALLLIPFYSLPITTSMLYRPVSAALFAPLSFFFLLKNVKFVLADLLLVLFALLAILQTAIIMSVNDMTDVAIRNSEPLILGVFCYFGAAYAIRKVGIDTAINLLCWTGVWIVIFGYVELTANIIHFPVIKAILNLLDGEIQEDRIQLFTREASWAAKCVTFYIPFLIYKAAVSRSFFFKAISASAFGLFLAILSLDGIFGVLFGLLLYYLATAKKQAKIFLFIMLPILIAVLVLFISLFGTVIAATLDSFNIYFLNRISVALRMDGIWNALKGFAFADDSTFIRIFYPIAGFKMFFENPFGSGLGSFAFHFQQFVPLDHIQLEQMPEVQSNVLNITADPKSLFAKIAAECGVLSGLPIVGFLFLCGRSAYRSVGRYAKCLYLSYCLTLGVLLQFGSFLYVPMWVVFALCLEESRGSPQRVATRRIYRLIAPLEDTEIGDTGKDISVLYGS